jgi:hypothetical protein
MAGGITTAGPTAVTALGTGGGFALLLVAIPASLSVAKDILFIAWSRRALFSRFRELATLTPGAVVSQPDPPIIRAPPPIAKA